jgi:hypothetical protein
VGQTWLDQSIDRLGSGDGPMGITVGDNSSVIYIYIIIIMFSVGDKVIVRMLIISNSLNMLIFCSFLKKSKVALIDL